MIVISDTTPILSLLKAEQLDLLEKLFDTVTVPETVYEELTTNPIFESEKAVIADCPFIIVGKVCNQESVKLLRNTAGLDAGESEALVLYEERNADLLFIDERKGRGIARKMSVKHVGTMGILMMAYDKDIISASEVKHCLEVLLDKDIRLSKNLCNKVLNYVGLDNMF